MILTQFIFMGLIAGAGMFLLLLGYRYLQILERRRYADPIDPNLVWQERRVIPVAEPLVGIVLLSPPPEQIIGFHNPMYFDKNGRLRPPDPPMFYRGKLRCAECYDLAVQIWREETAD